MVSKPTYEELEQLNNELLKRNVEMSGSLHDLTQSERLHRLILESISDTVLITDDDGQIIYVCPNTHVIFGLPQKEVYQLGNIEKLMCGFVCDVHELKRKKEVTNIEWSITDSQGRDHFLLINVKSVDIKGGTVLYVMRDATEHRLAAHNLIQSEYLLGETQKIANVGSYSLDLATMQVEWSDQNYRIFGYQPGEVQVNFDLVFGHIHPEDKERFLRANEAHHAVKTPYAETYRIIRKDGAVRHVFSQAHLIKDEQGHPVRTIGALQDITERVQSQKALSESEERLRQLLALSPGGIYQTDINGDCVYANASWLEMAGMPMDEARGKGWVKSLHPDDRDRIAENWHKMVASGGVWEDEYRFIDARGETVWVYGLAIPLRDSGDRMTGYLGLNIDITDRKKAEKEILRQKQKAEQYLNLASVMFIGLDSMGTVNLVNRRACEILECSKSEVVGRNWFDLFIPENHRQDVRSVFDQLISGKIDPVEYYENPIITQEGNLKYIAWHNTFLTDDRGNTVGVLASGQDITEKRALQIKLQQAQKMESIGNLAGGIAHDFNNILSSIIGFTELAMDEIEKGTNAQDYLHEVYAAGRRAKDLIKQILAFARQSDAQKKPIAPGTIAKEVLKLIRSTIPTTIDIRQDIQCDSLIMGDSTQFHQVLLNLCTNAAQSLEFMDGTINITMKEVSGDLLPEGVGTGRKEEKYIELRVSDDGVGIPPEVITKIFEPYFSTKPPGEGTGMGLAMVHGIIENYGGKIAVNSQLGQGTTFTIHLPVAQTSGISANHAPQTLATGKERILFVDDEQSIVKMGSQMLMSLGYTVTSFTGSLEALEAFGTAPDNFDLVITDMTMPKMSGDLLADEILRIRPDIPVILCTGYSKRLNEARVKKNGIKAVAHKPIIKKDMANLIRKALDEKNAKP